MLLSRLVIFGLEIFFAIENVGGKDVISCGKYRYLYPITIGIKKLNPFCGIWYTFVKSAGSLGSKKAPAIKPYGGEQRMALALGAGAMVAGKFILGQLLNEEQDWSPAHLFRVQIGGREYGLRTIQGDLLELASNPNRFIQHRLNPAFTRPVFQWLYGRDEFGRPRGAAQQIEDYAKGAVPIPLKGFATN